VAGQVRVLVVDDSAFVQRAVERMLDHDGIEVVGTASDGVEALQRARELSPDVILLDINMPLMDGLSALERIMAEAPTAVVLMSTLTRHDAEITIRGLELGAVDFIDKTEAAGAMDIYDLAPMLRRKVISAAGAALPPEAPPRPAAASPDRDEGDHVRQRMGGSGDSACPFDVVLLGASTGGPRAIGQILSALPEHFPLPVVVAQHMPPGFTATLAQRLDRRTAIRVREAADGDRLEPGLALIGPGGCGLSIERSGRDVVVRVGEPEREQAALPSVDALFESGASVFRERAIAAVLTGMGQDGARGLRVLREVGAATLVESEETAVIYGMPREARPSAVDALPLDRIAPTLMALCEGRDVEGRND